MPIGHELTKTAMAVESSLPANQSATILVINTPISTLPTPATSRPEIWPLQEDENAMMQLPAIIRTRPARTVFLSPNLCPMAPPGNASATPGTE
jgi:hypothetical protein